jgi:GMP synthase-like glutamine amidotransferase
VRALAIVHEAEAGPGVFSDSFAAQGVELEEWRIPEAPEPPGELASYGAVMTFGGAMHVDQVDRHQWIRREEELLRELIDRGTPLLGACLGAQLLCEAVGGSVTHMVEPEIGWYEIEVTDSGDPLVGALAPRFTGFEWHSYECVPPAGTEVVARSDACVQAFRIGSAWGIQFHSEVSVADANHWIDHWDDDADAVRIGLDHEALRAETNPRMDAWNEVGRGIAARFLEAAYSGVT